MEKIDQISMVMLCTCWQNEYQKDGPNETKRKETKERTENQMDRPGQERLKKRTNMDREKYIQLKHERRGMAGDLFVIVDSSDWKRLKE